MFGEPLPIDTAENIQIADQLNSSLSLFWHDAPFSDDWQPARQRFTEADGLRILEHRFVTPNMQPVSQQHLPDQHWCLMMLGSGALGS